MCEYFLVIPIDVPSFKLMEGQIKELQGVVPNTPSGAENDQKSPGRIGKRKCPLSKTHVKESNRYRFHICQTDC